MATVDFPNSPTIGDTFQYGDVSYTWDGTAWVLTAYTPEETPVHWDNILDPPTTFPPSPHTHTEGDITDLDKYDKATVDSMINSALSYTDDAVSTALNSANLYADNGDAAVLVTANAYTDSAISSIPPPDLSGYAELSGAVFTGTVQGLDPVGAADFVTKAYMDANSGADLDADYLWGGVHTYVSTVSNRNTNRIAFDNDGIFSNLYSAIGFYDEGAEIGQVRVRGGANSEIMMHVSPTTSSTRYSGITFRNSTSQNYQTAMIGVYNSVTSNTISGFRVFQSGDTNPDVAMYANGSPAFRYQGNRLMASYVLVLDVEGTADNHAVTKKYVDDAIAAALAA